MNNKYKMSITIFPDDVILDIFDFIRISRLDLGISYDYWELEWTRLAQVCRRW